MTTRYEQVAEVQRQIRWSTHHNLCPVCKVRPCGTWADGTPHITCGDKKCFLKWLPGRHEIADEEESEEHE
jgi:hypothetical protein